MRPKSRKSNPRPPKIEKVKHPRTSHSSPKKTHENLPNEVLTQIFEYLSLKELVRCGNTCQRWKLVISNTEKVWKMANLTNKNVPVSFLNHLSSQGTKYLSLQNARLIKDEEFSDIRESKFTHLNLYKTRGFQDGYDPFKNQASDVLEKLLKSCHFVEKLALTKLVLNPNFLTGIVQNASTLTVLNLWCCKGLTVDMIDVIFTNCQELTEVNMGATTGEDKFSSVLFEEAVDSFCKKISPKLQKLSLGGCEVRSCQIQTLVERCPNITELYLHATPLEDNSVDIIMKGFFKTLIKLQLPYYINLSALQGRRNPFAIGQIGPPKLNIGDLPNLKYLWYRKNDLEEDEKEILTQMLPKAIINQGTFDIASPNKTFWDIKCKCSDIFQEREPNPPRNSPMKVYLGFD